MASREEALRKIFETLGASSRLNEEQKRELLTHLEDAVEAKVGAGVPEMDAVGQAFAELGDLGKIGRQFPVAAPAALTAEGVRFLTDGRAYAWMAFCFFAFFLTLTWFVTPRFGDVYGQVKVPLPTVTRLLLAFSDLLRSGPGMAVMVLLMGGSLIHALRRPHVSTPVVFALLLGSVALCVGLVVALFLPLLSLLEGIGR